MKSKYIGFVLIAVIVMGVLTVGVGPIFSLPGEETAPTKEPLDDLEVVAPKEIEDELKDEADTLSAMQVDAQGEVAIGVSLVNLDNHPKDHLEFDILMDTHSVDLDKYDLAKMSQLSLDGALYPVETMEWRVTEGEGHHLRGRLVLSGPLLDTAILEVDEGIELQIVDLDGVASRVFRWKSVELADGEEGVSHDS